MQCYIYVLGSKRVYCTTKLDKQLTETRQDKTRQDKTDRQTDRQTVSVSSNIRRINNKARTNFFPPPIRSLLPRLLLIFVVSSCQERGRKEGRKEGVAARLTRRSAGQGSRCISMCKQWDRMLKNIFQQEKSLWTIYVYLLAV